MESVSILIPSRGRLPRLLHTIDSISDEDFIQIIVISDDCPETFEAMQAHPRVQARITQGHVGSVSARNLVAPECKDGLLYLTDDVILRPGAIKKALNIFNSVFPSNDGVIGLRQGQDHHPSGVGLIGCRFQDRYPDRKPFCIHFWHFCCQEIMLLAAHTGRFYYTEEVLVDHLGPQFDKRLADQTHRDARLHRKRDHELIKEREKKGLIWGLGAESACHNQTKSP